MRLHISIRGKVTLNNCRQLDPANNKTLLEIQQENALQKEQGGENSSSRKGKRKVAAMGSDDDSDDMQLDQSVNVDDSDDEGAVVPDIPLVPMPASGGIRELREKLHAKMVALRRGYRLEGEAGSRDELLEERRRQRADMRERRRKETREKIKREQEAKTKKGKEKDQQRLKGPQTKVCLVASLSLYTEILTTYPADTTACSRSTVWIKLEAAATRLRQRQLRHPWLEQKVPYARQDRLEPDTSTCPARRAQGEARETARGEAEGNPGEG